MMVSRSSDAPVAKLAVLANLASPGAFPAQLTAARETTTEVEGVRGQRDQERGDEDGKAHGDFLLNKIWRSASLRATQTARQSR
jgi:hypothetical protein